MTSAADLATALQRVLALVQSGRQSEGWAIIEPLRRDVDRNGQALRLYALTADAVGRLDCCIDALQRIVDLEHGPPEIIGALADTFGRSGRHDDAYRQWSRLVALRPGVADAHLNRAIAANDAGKHLAAIDAADDGLARFPGNARLLAVRALALKNSGQINPALDAFNLAIAADPSRALTYFNRAVTLRAAYRYDEACQTFAEAERRGLKGADLYAAWAASELEAGRVERSLERYAQALADNPAHQETMQALTRVHVEYRTGEDPFAHFANLARLRPNDPSAWISWANALALNQNYAGAAAVAADGATIHPGSRELPMIALFGEGMAGDATAPASRLIQLFRDDPDNELLWATVSQLGLRAGRPEAAEDAAARMVAKYPYHQSAWSLLSLAWRALADEREHWLCDYDRLVMTVDVPSSDGSMSAASYAAWIAEALAARHNTLAAPGDQSLRHGTQTGGALFDDPDPAIQQFRAAVSAAAAKAVVELGDDPRHPFLSRKATSFRFSGSWSVRLRSGGGHHVPHFHSEGWMSSAYYARLPSADDGMRRRQEGWIEFGRPPPIFNLDFEPRRVIEPVEGRLALFPSYMWHGTIPFAKGERLTAAFDYQPLG